MSYKSHAQNELTNYTDATDAEKEIIYQCLEVVSEQGHSGGSIGFIISHLEAVAADPNRSLEKDGMIWPIIQPAKHLPVEQQLRLFRWLHLIVAFQPLSPLTGEDSEWNRLGYDDDTRYQNRRCGRIFKDANGVARDIDGRSTYYPSSSYCSWSGTSAPSPIITFPYTPTTDRVFYISEASRIRIQPGVDHNALMETWWWLHLSGVNPVTGKFRRAAVFCTEEQAAAAKLEYDTNLAGKTYRDRYSAELYVGEYEITGNPEIDAAAKAADAAKQRAARIFSLVGRHTHIRDDIYLGDDGIEYRLVYLPVRRPDRNYQQWGHMHTPGGRVGAWVLCEYNPRFPDRDLWPLHFDKVHGQYEIIAGDQDDYLYSRRRELKLAHPKRQLNALTSESTVDTCPSAAPALVFLTNADSARELARATLRRIDENTRDMYDRLFELTQVYRSNLVRAEMRRMLDTEMGELFAMIKGTHSCDARALAALECHLTDLVQRLRTAFPAVGQLAGDNIWWKYRVDGAAVVLDPSEELRVVLEDSDTPLLLVGDAPTHDELRESFRQFYKDTYGE